MVTRQPLKPHEIQEMKEYSEMIHHAMTSYVTASKFFTTSLTDKNVIVDGKSTKVIHFIRHGQGTHNVWGGEWMDAKKQGNAYSDPMCPVDSKLTDYGKAQAESLNETLREACQHFSEIKVITSPLRRAIETAYIATQGLNAKYIALEHIHEQGGLHHCDRRLGLKELKDEYPYVDFSLIETEEDPLWGDGSERELSSSVLNRCLSFLNWLKDVPDTDVIVVSHSSFLHHLFNSFLDCDDESIREWFRTGELRSVVVSF